MEMLELVRDIINLMRRLDTVAHRSTSYVLSDQITGSQVFSTTIVISVVVSILGKSKYFKAAQLRLIQMESRDIFLETKKKREKERKKEKNGRKEEKRKYHVYK